MIAIMDIPPELAPLVRVNQHGYLVNQIRGVEALLAEIEPLDNADGLRVYLNAQLDSVVAQMRRFERALVVLGEKKPVYDAAKRELEDAVSLRNEGSSDAKEALALRDRWEVADQRFRIAHREFQKATSDCGGLPINAIMAHHAEMRTCAGVVETIAANAASNRKQPEAPRKIDGAVWERWLTLSSDETRWEPLFLAREVKASEALLKKHAEAKFWPHGETIPSDPGELRAIHAQLTRDRAEKKKWILAQARQNLARVEAEVAR